MNEVDDSFTNNEERKLVRLLSQKDYSEAFFIARRLVAQGEDWAEEYLSKARRGLN